MNPHTSLALASIALLLGAGAALPAAADNLATPGHITIHHFPGGVGTKLLVAPPQWTCRDDNDPDHGVVSAGSFLDDYGQANPYGPSVTCSSGGITPCTSVVAGGYHSKVGSGTLYVTSRCATYLSATAAMTLPTSVGTSSRNTGADRLPWTCFVDAHGVVSQEADTDYWVFCEVNT